ncbi:MAG: HlyD family efflux transporter periplasmic adaptor subunit [Muribaculaceae bacterium]|nr:HlyD family efflux transporter periplasmic adaptor subunit [Muribaculaceae bacterium]
MKKKLFIIIGLAMALTACGSGEKEFDATGTFEATEVTVSAKASGELRSFSIVEGQDVEKDMVLGGIDVTQLRLKKDELSTAYSQLGANQRQLDATKSVNSSRQLDLEKQVGVIKQQIANARRERQRYSELVADGAVPRKQLDEIDYQIKVLEKQLAATVDQLTATNSSLDNQNLATDAQIGGIDAQRRGIEAQQAQIDDQISNATVKSPISGTVLEKYVEQGEFVTTGKPLFKVADTRNMFLRAYITSAQLEKIKLGQKVTVMSDYGDNKGKSYEGTVAWISERSEFTPKTIQTDDERADMVYAVKIAVKNDGLLKIGMYGKVKLSK